MATQSNMFSTIPTVDASDLHAFLDMCHGAKRVPLVYGPPGVGKSTIVQQWAQSHGYALYDIRLAQLLPEHLAAIQYPDDKREHVVRLTPAIVADVHKLRASTGKPVLIFADEITLSSQETLSAALELILDGRVNGFALPADTWIVAAGNRPQDTSSAAVLDPPVRSRVVSCVYIPAPEDVAAYIAKRFPGDALADVVSRFITSQQARTYVSRDEIGDDASFYTPRGLESAVALASPHVRDVTQLAKSKLARLAFAGTVGAAFFASLASWAQVAAQVTDAAAILADPSGADIPDTQQALSAQLDALRDHCRKSSDAKSWQKFVSYMSAAKPEFVEVWLNAQSSDTIESIGSSARGMRFLDSMGAGTADESDVAAARKR